MSEVFALPLMIQHCPVGFADGSTPSPVPPRADVLREARRWLIEGATG